MINKDSGKKIIDNPSMKSLRTTLPLVRLLGSVADFAAKIGIKRAAMVKFKSEANKLVANADILELPDRFNSAFAEKGWIATGSFALNVMQMAVSLHDESKDEDAENIVLEWFDEDNIRYLAITRAKRFHVAHLRDEQLQEALRLYLEKRYMAAVPLILIACDGFASDVSGISPFEKNADLTCFDSITGHQSSLPAFIKLLIQGVRNSTDTELSIPIRHGILHGRSLGYANKIVCAKAWLLMVALVDWAIDKSSEERRIEEHRLKENTSLLDTLKRYSHVQVDKKAIEAFKIYETIGPFNQLYGLDTAEYAILEFLEGWNKRNFGRMAKHAVNPAQKPINQMAGEMRNTAGLVKLDKYEIIRIRHSSVARCDVQVRIQAKTLKKAVSGNFKLILFRYTTYGAIAMPTNQDGVWAVQQNCIYDVINEKFSDFDQ